MGFFDKVKDVAGKVGDSVEKGAKSVSDSSKKMAEKMRLKKEISQIESEITAAYTAIGKKYFEINSASPAEEYADKITEIIEKNAKAESLKVELNALEDRVPCPNCGASVEKGQKFCAKCGANVESVSCATPVPDSSAEKSDKVCPSCGAVAAESQKFCEACGAKIEDESSETVETVEAEVVEEKTEE